MAVRRSGCAPPCSSPDRRTPFAISFFKFLLFSGPPMYHRHIFPVMIGSNVYIVITDSTVSAAFLACQWLVRSLRLRFSCKHPTKNRIIKLDARTEGPNRPESRLPRTGPKRVHLIP